MKCLSCRARIAYHSGETGPSTNGWQSPCTCDPLRSEAGSADYGHQHTPEMRRAAMRSRHQDGHKVAENEGDE